LATPAFVLVRAIGLPQTHLYGWHGGTLGLRTSARRRRPPSPVFSPLQKPRPTRRAPEGLLSGEALIDFALIGYPPRRELRPVLLGLLSPSRRRPTPQTHPNRLHSHPHPLTQPSAWHTRVAHTSSHITDLTRSACAPASPHNTGLCATWVCISPSSSFLVLLR